jgi:superfamily I DNA/RNA helicase
VRIQQVVAQAIDAASVGAQTEVSQEIDGEAAQVWSFPNSDTEAEKVAQWIANDIRERSKSPRDYALLARQRVDRFEEQLSPALSRHGLRLRNESKRVGAMTLQDLLVDDLVEIVIAIIKLAIHRRSPEYWSIASTALIRLRGVDTDDDRACQRSEKQLTAFVERLRVYLNRANPPHRTYAGVIIKNILEFLDPGALSRAYPQYGTGDNLKITMEALQVHFTESAHRAESWEDCVRKFEGENCIPLMTVHKSKGLEYDTIIFLSLDGRTWSNRPRGNVEGIATFFVGLSRAKQRVIFTLCDSRDAKDLVQDLYTLLADAGVSEIDHPALPQAERPTT